MESDPSNMLYISFENDFKLSTFRVNFRHNAPLSPELWNEYFSNLEKDMNRLFNIVDNFEIDSSFLDKYEEFISDFSGGST